MNIKKKSILLTLIFSFFILIFIGFSVKTYLIFSYSAKDLKRIVNVFFKKNLNRAVDFEKIYIDFSGDIVVSNFKLSASSDFNDNLSAVQCKRALFKLKLFSLLKGKTVIKGIYFEESDITFRKRFEKNYIDTLDRIIDLINNPSKVSDFDFNNLYIKFSDSNFFYKQVFSDSRTSIRLFDITSVIKFKNNKLLYDIDGLIEKFKSNEISRGEFDSNGTYVPGDNSFECDIEIENFDLSYFNDFIRNYKIANLSIFGGVGFNLKLSSKKKHLSAKGRIEANNLNVVSLQDEQFNIVSNANIDIKTDMIFKGSVKSAVINNINLFNDIININASGMFDLNKKIDLSIISNKVNLFNLSTYLTLWKDFSYGGFLGLKSKILFDVEKRKDMGSSLKLFFEDFNCKKLKDGKKKKIITKANGTITYKNNVFNLISGLNTEKSDININLKTEVKEWYPIKSDSVISFDSKKLNSGVLYYFISNSVNNLYSQAYDDKKRGYEEIFFMQKTIGQLLSSNNILMDFNFDKIVFGKKAYLSNFQLKSELQNGMLLLKNFKVEGYNANFNLNFYALFNRDYPFVLVEGGIAGFDLEKFSKDYGESTQITGKAYVDYKYEVTAYRLSQILENSKGEVNVRISPGKISAVKTIEKVTKYLSDHKYNGINLDEVNFNSMGFSIAQYGGNFYFRNLSISSDKVNFTSYGKYFYQNGIEMNMYANVKGEKNFSIPLEVSGQLLDPCLKIKNRNIKEKLCF